MILSHIIHWNIHLSVADEAPGQGRRRLKITVRRPPGTGITRGERVSRTRPRFYVVTRTGSPGQSLRRGSLRPVSVKITRRPKISETPRYETYTTVTSVPVIFGLSTTYRNAIVTSSFPIPSSAPVPEVPEPSKTLVLTYFTTTTYTVPFTVSGDTSFTTFEETNSRIVTETVGEFCNNVNLWSFSVLICLEKAFLFRLWNPWKEC